MRSPAWKLISKMLSAEGKGSPSSEMLDVIRVLVVYNGAGWKSELIRELSFLRKFKNESEIESGLVEKALRKLKEEDLVTVERKVRADMGYSGGVKDELITLVDLSAAERAMAGDRVLLSYMRERLIFPVM